jgi:NAD(P)-dependent dehydrogenase (short-subunit alcohol dehydrogenase family)
MWAQTPGGHSYGYVSAKGALLAFSRNLAQELAPRGICVNALTPGEINTRMNADKTLAEKEQDYEQIPVGRWAEPVEVSYLVAYLASDEAAFVTGQTIPINGGQVIAGY